MTPEQGIVLGVAGLLGGAVNSVAGGGSLISFPALLAVGYPSVTANVTNTVALFPGYLGATTAYRKELEGQRSRVVVLGASSIAGGVVGSALLLTTPGSVFKAVVPWLILLACALFGLQPLATRKLADRQVGSKGHRSPGLHAAIFLAAVYGAYFGAGLGIVLLAVLGPRDHRQPAAAERSEAGSLGADQRGGGRRLRRLRTRGLERRGDHGRGEPRRGTPGGSFARRLHPTVLRVLVLAFGVTVGCILLARQ